MEDDEISSGGGSGMIPIALAVLAIVLGGAALYFGLTANQRLGPIRESVASGGASAARMEKEIDALETRIDEIVARLDDLKGAFDRSRIYANQSEAAIKRLTSELNENRDRINTLGERLGELAGASARAPASGPEPTGESATGGRTAPERAGEAERDEAAESYRIQSGDTFAKIAAEQGVRLQALIDANPEADPRR